MATCEGTRQAIGGCHFFCGSARSHVRVVNAPGLGSKPNGSQSGEGLSGEVGIP
jgi:hypothetical protein